MRWSIAWNPEMTDLLKPKSARPEWNPEKGTFPGLPRGDGKGFKGQSLPFKR
jgi:hypothetical protein